MHIRTAAVLAGAWCLAGAAAAQSTAESDADRMERIKRDAANPLRLIIESSQIKPRAKPTDPAPPAAAPVRVPERRVVVAPRAETPTARPAALPTAAGSDEVATANPPAPAAAPTPASTMPADAAPPEPEPVVARLEAPSPPPEPPKLELLRMVDPDVPARVRSKLKKSNEITVDLTVQRDGTVADVVVHDTSSALLNDAVIAAVRQWRYAPLPEARAHRVALVYKVND